MKIIKVTAKQTFEVVEITGQPSLQLMRDLIGGHIEHVLPKRLPGPYCMIVDEEGRLKGLPINWYASLLYETDIHGTPIVGDILLMKDAWIDGECDIVGLNDQDVEFLMTGKVTVHG
jgi:hypothetical protein